MISWPELGTDEDLARRVLATARSIAPTLHDVTEQAAREDLVAVLRGVYSEAQQRGARHVKSQRVGPAAVEYRDASSWFTEDDRATLRSICAVATTSQFAPIGRFPLPNRATTKLWPEQYES